MNTRIEYICKFCHRARLFNCDISPDCPPLDLEKWKSLLVCDVCADFERSRRDMEWAVAKQAASLRAVRYGVTNVDKLAQLEQKVRENLISLTKKYCKIVCDRHGKPFFWEPEIVEFIMNNPTVPYDVLSQFKQTIVRGQIRR